MTIRTIFRQHTNHATSQKGRGERVDAVTSSEITHLAISGQNQAGLLEI
jgi:hypothetical protein